MQANSVCNLTRRGFLVRKVYRARNVSLGHSTVKLKLELELELVLVDVEPMGSGSSLSDFTPPVPEMTIEIDSWNRFALDSTETRSNDSFWSVATLHHRVVLAPLWLGNVVWEWVETRCHVVEYNIWCKLLVFWNYCREIFEISRILHVENRVSRSSFIRIKCDVRICRARYIGQFWEAVIDMEI